MGLRALIGLDAPERASAPASPPAGRRLLYPKGDGWYERNSAGVETKLGAGGSSGGGATVQAAQPTSPSTGQMWWDTDEPGGVSALATLDTAQTFTAPKTFGAGSEDSVANVTTVPSTTRAPTGQTTDLHQWIINNLLMARVGPDGVLYEGGRRITRLTSRLTTDFTSTAASLTNTGLSVALAAGKVYTFRAFMHYQSNATANGIRVGTTYSGTMPALPNGRVTYSITSGTTVTTVSQGTPTGNTLTTATAAATTWYPLIVEGIIATSTAGNFQIVEGSEVAGSQVIIPAFSYLEAAEMA